MQLPSCPSSMIEVGKELLNNDESSEQAAGAGTSVQRPDGVISSTPQPSRQSRIIAESTPGINHPLRCCSDSLAASKSVSGICYSDHQGSFPAFAILLIASTLRSTSSSVVAQHDTLMRIAVCPCHCVPPHQHVPSL